MAKCYYCEYLYSDNKYRCSLTGLQYDTDDPKIKFVCYPEYGDEYKKCEVYKSS